MDDWFKFGSKVGRFSVIKARHHGTGLQRFDAQDRRHKRRVILSCAKPDREAWASKFEELALARAALQFGPKVVGHGITHDGVFYVAEEAQDVQPLFVLPLAHGSICALMYSAGDELANFAEAGFLHGALDPTETFWLSNREPVIYGAGIRQILGVMDGAGVLGGEHTAPEIVEGKPWGERADVFGLCSCVGSLWRGKGKQDDFWSGLGALGETIKEGCLHDLDARPCWAVLNPPIADVMESEIKAIRRKGGAGDADDNKRFAQEIHEVWLAGRPSSETDSTAGSDKRPIDTTHSTAEVEEFEDWEIDHQTVVRSDEIETFICQPIGALETDLLRRAQASNADAATLKQLSAKRDEAKHKNIPRLVGAGVARDGWVYWVEAGTNTKSFRDWAKRGQNHFERGVRTVKAVCAYAEALAEGASFGVYHGDLVPDRDLLLSAVDDTPLVFGIGALQGFGLERSPTQNPYAAPERRAGEAFDFRADIYALGLILCEAIAGRAPRGDGVIRGLDRLDAFDRSLRQIISRAISRDPSDRFEKWVNFLDELENCLQDLERRMRTSAASVPMPRTAPTTAPAHTPTSWTPSSSDPTPPPAPQGPPAAEPDAARVLELVVNPANENTRRGPKGMEGEAIDRETLPSPLFVYPPPKAANEPSPASAKASRGPVWIASSVVLLAGVAASFAVLWSAGTPTLDSTPNTTQETQAFEAPIFRPTINTAEALRSTEKPRTKALEFEGVAYRFNERGECNEE